MVLGDCQKHYKCSEYCSLCQVSAYLGQNRTQLQNTVNWQRDWNAHLFSHVPALGMVYMGGMVYAVGGFNGSLRVRTVDSYDPVKDQWTSVANMQDRRSTLGAAVLNGLLYAVGGFDGSTGMFA